MRLLRRPLRPVWWCDPSRGEGVRVTIGEPAANNCWLAVLRDFLRL